MAFGVSVMVCFCDAFPSYLAFILFSEVRTFETYIKHFIFRINLND